MQKTRESFAKVVAEFKRSGRLNSRERFADELIAEWNRVDRDGTTTR